MLTREEILKNSHSINIRGPEGVDVGERCDTLGSNFFVNLL